jgi:alkylhydroperoxidase family enzyme
MARIPYVDEADATPEAAAALREIRDRRGFVSSIHRSLAHSAPVLEAYEQFSSRLSAASRLDARTRELVILRVAQLVGNLFAWRRHLPRALQVGLARVDIASLGRWHDSAAFSAPERAVLALVDQHVTWHQTEATTVRDVRDGYGDELLIEILVLIGWYQLAAAISMPLDLVADDPEPADLPVPFERAVPWRPDQISAGS